ncbi:DUF4252 domain-containing protein [Bacteroides sp.]|uniref:DUF4252 domain-containing protein n=1 Tax=Bacteroides sp. TaxID=29523 RepID=UPI00261589B3|nr:DUF4252 domain-containing protein [Bacteroides sp.]
MKTMKFILACLLFLSPLLCQAQKNLFNKYNDMKGVSSVYISKAMMELNPNLFMKDLYIGKVADRLNSVQVFSTKEDKVKAEMLKDIRSLVQSSKYELLMKQKGTVSGSEVYVNRKGNKIKELIMVMDGAASLKFVYMEGDMTSDDIKKLMLYQNTGMNTGGNMHHIFDGSYNLADANIWDNLKKMEGLQGLEGLKGLESLKNLESLKGLSSLKDLSKLKDSEYLKKQMDTETWKSFEKSMELLEERLENLE